MDQFLEKFTFWKGGWARAPMLTSKSANRQKASLLKVATEEKTLETNYQNKIRFGNYLCMYKYINILYGYVFLSFGLWW